MSEPRSAQTPPRSLPGTPQEDSWSEDPDSDSPSIDETPSPGVSELRKRFEGLPAFDTGVRRALWVGREQDTRSLERRLMTMTQPEHSENDGSGDPAAALANHEPVPPTTVHTIQCSNLATVSIVGTAHFSLQSQEDVRRVIRETHPRYVVVELCRSRGLVMCKSPEELRLDQNPLSWHSVREKVHQHNSLMVGVLNSLLVYLSLKITEKTGLVPGGEFRAAFEESKKLDPPPTICFGDRDILTTLQRAWYSLTTWQRWKLIYHLLTSDTDISMEEIEKCKQSDILEAMLKELEADFPVVSRVIVTERDEYLTRTIHQTALKAPGSHVVAVVGIGHLPGIVRNWDRADSINLDQLCRIPKQSSLIPWKRITQLTVISACSYFAYKMLRR